MTPRRKANADVSRPVSRPEMRRKGQTTRPAPITWQTARCEATADGWFFELPVPERTNAIWRSWKGRTLVSAKHRADKVEAPKKFGRCEPLRGDVAVRITWVRQRKAGDVDGRVKATLDLLRGVAYGDDAQVTDLHIIRSDDPHRAPGMYVLVVPADTPAVHHAA